jgi:hypothetical protein
MAENLNRQPDVHWHSILWLKAPYQLSLHSLRDPQVSDTPA